MNDFNTSPKAPATRQELSHDDIARRAYAIYLNTGCQPGQCEQNWCQAEAELREMTAKPGMSRIAGAAHESSARSASKSAIRTRASTPSNSSGNADEQKATTITKRRGKSRSQRSAK